MKVKNVVYTCKEVHILFLQKVNSCRMLQYFVYFSGKFIFSAKFLRISETKTRILKNFSSRNDYL